MKQDKYAKLFDGQIKIIHFDIKQLKDQTRDDYLKSIWKVHRMSDEPVLIISPFMKPDIWKRIRLTNIYLTCDTIDRDIETELRTLLAPQPNIFERMMISVHNLIFKTRQINIVEQIYPQPTYLNVSWGS